MTYPLSPLISGEMPDIHGKSILITGGTGSFGQAFARRLLDHHQPKRLVLLSRDEQKHHALQQRLQQRGLDSRLRFFVGDIRDKDRLRRAFTGIDLVFHAAAMKHVHISEYNPIEAIRTNVDGAANVIDAAIEATARTQVNPFANQSCTHSACRCAATG